MRGQTTARMTALRPGASPPPVEIAIRIVCSRDLAYDFGAGPPPPRARINRTTSPGSA